VPLESGEPVTRVGLRTGPRLSVPLSRPDEFRGDDAPFSFPQWSLAYDAEVLVPMGGQFGMHLGFQGEVGCERGGGSCPIPVPGYGASLGLSHYVGNGTFSFAPAVVLRGASDFGLGSTGGPGSLLGVEASTTFALHEGTTALGLVPFCGVHRVLGSSTEATALYFGAVLAGHFASGGEFLEVTAGLGRAEMRDGPRWTVPLFGLRGGP
jgi:hypothetical protein